MSKKHADALTAKSEELVQFSGKVFLTEAPHGTVPPYLVWHPANGSNTQEAVTGPRVTKHPRFTGHVVGVSAGQVLILMDALEELLFPAGRGIRLSVDGERSSPLWFKSPLPVQKQVDPQPSVIYGVVEVGWRADPA